MNMAVLLVANTAEALLLAIEICMLVRAVLSWLPIGDDNLLVRIAYVVTEPIIAPIRKLLDRTGWFRNLPIDMSFLFAVLLLSLVSTLLSTVTL